MDVSLSVASRCSGFMFLLTWYNRKRGGIMSSGKWFPYNFGKPHSIIFISGYAFPMFSGACLPGKYKIDSFKKEKKKGEIGEELSKFSGSRGGVKR
jgi:hypothetical protein